MATLALDDILEVNIYCILQNQISVNVRHFRVFNMAPGEDFSDLDVAAAAAEEFSTLYAPVIATPCHFRGVRVRRIHPTETAWVQNVAFDTAGSAGADIMPKQVAGLISLKSNVPGRAGLGRVYMPFPAEQSNDTDATPTATYITNLAAVAAKFVQLNVANPTPAVMQMEGLVLNRAVPPDSGIIILATAQDKWATQRRRGDYGRINTSPI